MPLRTDANLDELLQVAYDLAEETGDARAAYIRAMTNPPVAVSPIFYRVLLKDGSWLGGTMNYPTATRAGSFWTTEWAVKTFYDAAARGLAAALKPGRIIEFVGLPGRIVEVEDEVP